MTNGSCACVHGPSGPFAHAMPTQRCAPQGAEYSATNRPFGSSCTSGPQKSPSRAPFASFTQPGHARRESPWSGMIEPTGAQGPASVRDFDLKTGKPFSRLNRNVYEVQ